MMNGSAFWNALPAIIGAVVLGIISLGTFIRAGRAERHAREAAATVEAVREDVKIIEKATNSMKDALVAATDKAARAEGHAEGVKDQKIDAASMAQQPPETKGGAS